MTVTNINFSETDLFSKLILDYLSGDNNTREFYKYAPLIEEMETVIQDKMNLVPTEEDTINRRLLVDTIQQQYQGLDISEQVHENIQSLGNSISFCIVTAHQLNIFGGPLYFIYKIAQTISTCRHLSEKYPNNNFIPVYWMGSEDHDFEEVNHIHLFNRKMEWTDKQGGATGAYTTASILPLIDEISAVLGEGPLAKEIAGIFRTAYALPTLTKATQYLVNALFGKYGLVIVDGNDNTFKQQFAEIMKDELLQHNSVKLVLEQLQKLELKGYKQQAFPREINLFYLSPNSRERIEYSIAEDQYKILNTSLAFSKEEILKELELHPERFSPNVILRPLFQQKVLPSLAYIGGAGELSYWLQLKPVFDFYKINYPQLLLRNSALLINESNSKKISKMGFVPQDFFKETDQLIRTFISKNTEEDIDVNAYKEAIALEFSKLQEVAKSVDPTLVNVVGAEMQKTMQSIDNLQKRLMKSLKQKNETELNQIEKIRSQLFPGNSLQERSENFSSFYALKGAAFIEELIGQFDVYNKQFLIISG